MEKLYIFILIFISKITIVNSSSKGFQKTIRVLTLNVYGKQEEECSNRLKTIGKKILQATPPYDIVALNEHYDPLIRLWLSCDGEILTNELLKDGRYSNQNDITRNYLQFPKGKFYQVNGGNSIFTLHHFVKFNYNIFSNHRVFVPNGYLFSRIKITNELSIDLWTTHLEDKQSSKCSDKCRLQQVKEISNKIKKMKSQNLSLVVGDFNIGGPLNMAQKKKHLSSRDEYAYTGNQGYEKIIELFDTPRDVWLEKNPSLPPNEAYTFDCTVNNTASDECKHFFRIDYIFLLKKQPKPKSNYSVDIIASNLIRWKTTKGKDVSDHYGVEATIRIHKK